jgi:hypothetical protein
MPLSSLDDNCRSKLMQGRFADRILMRVIGAGVEIPWPDPLCFKGFVLAKDYRMNGFPRMPDGQPWYEVPDEEYLAWLADYLPENLPPLTAEQKRLADHPEHDKLLDGFWIGEIAGWYESEGASRPNYEFPPDFLQTGDIHSAKLKEGGYTYEYYYDSWKDDLAPDELLTREELIRDEFGWHLAKEEEDKQFALLWPEFKKYDAYNIIFQTNTLRHEPPDAGWRVYLALVLRKIPEKTARIKELEQFYFYWRDMIAK